MVQLSFALCARLVLVVLVTDRIGCDATGTSFIQKSVSKGRSALALTAPSGPHGSGTCADLTNRGTHFTVDLEVGTPGQKFSVVADTGSNSLIVPSCICQQRRYCSKSDRCFTGTNKSTSFALKEGPQGLQSVFITFGSGTIEAIVAKEKVAVGHLNVDMKDGILLMVARNLNIAGKFEGILGLGLPAKSAPKTKPKHRARPSHGDPRTSARDPRTSAKIKDLMKKIFGGIMGGNQQSGQLPAADTMLMPADDDILEPSTFSLPNQAQLGMPRELDDIGDIIQTNAQDANAAALETGPMTNALKIVPGFPQHGGLGFRHDMQHEQEDSHEVLGPKGLLEQAGISRFSMCFNDGASGVLNLDTPKMSDSLPSVGKFHWGLDFRGISIGNTSAPVSFCSTANMTKGQETPCGAIPDSGTTVIMAPKEHLSLLLDSICDEWPRCKSNYTAMVEAAEAAKKKAETIYSFDPFQITPATKSTILQLLLLDCGSWLNESTGLNELPALKFHMAGAGGNKKTLELPGWAYILESTHDDAKKNNKRGGMEDIVFLQNRTSRPSKVCSPAFGAMSYNTQKNGPVWILGTPFFYEFHVGYDMNTSPPSISFASTEKTPCTRCGQQASLLDSRRDRHRPRWISGPLRIPDMDMDLPL